MIQPTSPSDRTARADAVPAASNKSVDRSPGPDRFSASHSSALRAVLAAQPEIRPEVVAHGRALAADPSYPPREILQRVGKLLLNSPDLTEDN